MIRFISLLTVVAFGACASVGAEEAPETSLPDPDDWALVWADEFNGEEIDSSKWTHEVDCWGGGNDERQCYTTLPTNSKVADGKLSIIAQIQPAEGPALPPRLLETVPEEERGATKKQPFTSARLNTKGKADWTYGRFETRAKMPVGQGVWSAIWMLPTDEIYGTWAASGEIDIVEAVNLGALCKKCDDRKENRAIGTIHYGGEWPRNKYKGKHVEMPESEDGFHTYAVEWEAGKITWFIDGEPYSTLTSKDWGSGALFSKKSKTAPFDQPFHLILNVAIGGNLAEDNNSGGISIADFPKAMEVDWIRVYQRKETETSEAGE